MTQALAPGSGWGVASLLTGVVALFLVLFAILDTLFGRTPVQRRIASIKLYTAGARKPQASTPRMLLANLGDAVGASPVLARFATRSEPLLDQLAGTPHPNEWLGIRIVAGLAGNLLLLVLMPAWVSVLIGCLGGFFLPNGLLRSRIKRRRQRFTDDLPGILHLMLSSLRSGFTLQQAVEAAVTDDEGPVAEELSRALSESRISGEFEDALERVGDRVESQEMLWLVMALRLQREVGGSLADIMQTTADTMRERAYLRRHVRTLSAEGRISAYVLMALPVGISGLIFFTRPDYIRPLFSQAAGIILLSVAFLLLVVGVAWLRAACKVEV